MTTQRSKILSKGGYDSSGSRGSSKKYPSREAALSERSSVGVSDAVAFDQDPAVLPSAARKRRSTENPFPSSAVAPARLSMRDTNTSFSTTFKRLSYLDSGHGEVRDDNAAVEGLVQGGV